jgi:hypothetical protein
MALFKKKNLPEDKLIKSFELGGRQLDELPPLPDEEDDLEVPQNDYLDEDINTDDEEEELEEMDEEIEIEEPIAIKPLLKKREQIPKVEKPIVSNDKLELENLKREHLGYFIEMKNYILKLEEVVLNQERRISNIEGFAFRVKTS